MYKEYYNVIKKTKTNISKNVFYECAKMGSNGLLGWVIGLGWGRRVLPKSSGEVQSQV